MRVRGVCACDFLLGVDYGGLQAVEVGDAENGCGVDVELLFGIFVVVALAFQTNPQSSGQATDATLPNLLVQLGVETNVLDAHCLLCELDHLLDGCRSTLLELNIVHALVQMDGVVTGNDVVQR